MSKKNKEPRIRVSADTLRKLEILKYYWSSGSGESFSFDRTIVSLIDIMKHYHDDIEIHGLRMSYLLSDDAKVIAGSYTSEQMDNFTDDEYRALPREPLTAEHLIKMDGRKKEEEDTEEEIVRREEETARNEKRIEGNRKTIATLKATLARNERGETK